MEIILKNIDLKNLLFYELSYYYDNENKKYNDSDIDKVVGILNKWDVIKNNADDLLDYIIEYECYDCHPKIFYEIIKHVKDINKIYIDNNWCNSYPKQTTPLYSLCMTMSKDDRYHLVKCLVDMYEDTIIWTNTPNGKYICINEIDKSDSPKTYEYLTDKYKNKII